MTDAETTAHKALLSLLEAHRPIECPGCTGPGGDAVILDARLGHESEKLDQSMGPPLDAAVYECSCGWRKTVALHLILQTGGAQVAAALRF